MKISKIKPREPSLKFFLEEDRIEIVLKILMVYID
jgi:hypothetical protein